LMIMNDSDCDPLTIDKLEAAAMIGTCIVYIMPCTAGMTINDARQCMCIKLTLEI